MMMRGVAASSSSSSSVASVVDVAAAAACVSPPSVALMGSSVFTRVFLVTGLPLSGTLSLLAVAGSIFFGI
jgi:hypothetical protein